jgi:hypothetical protein
MTLRTFIACLVAAAAGAAAVLHVTAHPMALPLSSPFGAYETRAEALSAAHDALDQAATCVRVEAVNDTKTELQPC